MFFTCLRLSFTWPATAPRLPHVSSKLHGTNSGHNIFNQDIQYKRSLYTSISSCEQTGSPFLSHPPASPPCLEPPDPGMNPAAPGHRDRLARTWHIRCTSVFSKSTNSHQTGGNTNAQSTQTHPVHAGAHRDDDRLSRPGHGVRRHRRRHDERELLPLFHLRPAHERRH